MPLPDAAVDRILLVHALEMSDDPEGLLREVWRVLAPSGRMIAVIPNRRGVWTRTDNTPFGHGRPYSRSQITQLLRQTWFTPTAWGEALFVPPVAGGWFLRSAMAWERVGAALSLPFAGVHIVEATKQVYRAIPAKRERTRLIPALEPVLVPSSTRDGRCRESRSAKAHRACTAIAISQKWPLALHLRSCVSTGYSLPGLKSSLGPAAAPGHAFGARAVRTAPAARETFAAAIAFETATVPPLICGCGPVMKEGRRSTPPLSAAAGCGGCCVLRLRAVFAFAMLARLLLVALIGLLLVAPPLSRLSRV